MSNVESTVDFSNKTNAELAEALAHINGAEFPANLRACEAEISKRKMAHSWHEQKSQKAHHGSYEKQWLDYRSKLRRYWILSLACIPYFCICTMITKNWFLFAALFLPLFVVAGVAENKAARFQCPRCKQKFWQGWIRGYWLFNEKCAHCGLKKYEGSDL